MERLAGDSQVALVLEHRNVKRINITVRWDGSIKVTMPLWMNEQVIGEVLERRRRWIERKLEEMRVRRERFPSCYQFKEGEIFWIFGHAAVLQVLEGDEEEVIVKDGALQIRVPGREPEKVRAALVRWYKKQALKAVEERVDEFSPLLGIRPEGIELGEWKRKWGVCEVPGRIVKFNWRLAQLPDELIDFIVVHELAHLSHPRHGKNFWHNIKRVLPDYASRREALKEWSGALMW